ncbi:MAG: alginate lyase family protein [Planctomycetota bacterium]|jgi:hypothetical protein
MKTFFRAAGGLAAFLPLLPLPVLAATAGEGPGEGAWRHEAVFVSEARLLTLRLRIQRKVRPTYEAWVRLKRSADRNLDAAPHAPAKWYVPGYYRDAKGHRAAKQGLADDANRSYELALVHRMTGDERYARAAARLIDAWPATVKSTSRKDDSTLSFSYHFPSMIFAADLISRSRAWPEESQGAFRQFVREKALPLNTMGRSNNWGNWGLVLVAAAAAYLDDRPLLKKCAERWKELIGKQIAEDGHMHHEVRRNGGRSGLWYTHFSLFPQTIAAEVLRVNGFDLYEHRSADGRTLRLAFDRVAPWARRPETFPYWKDDPGRLHGRTYVSYFEVLNARWPNPDASAMLEDLRPLTASHSAPQMTFTHGGLLDDDPYGLRGRRGR